MPVDPGARYVCGDEERRAALERAIANGVAINGIDFLEVIDNELVGTTAEDEPAAHPARAVLCRGARGIDIDRIRIDGGVRIAPVHVRWVALLDAISAAAPVEIPVEERQFLATYRLGEIDRTRIVAVGTEERGDFSTYRLSIVEPGDVVPLVGFDPRLFSVEFSFKVECPSEFDCKPPALCPPPELTEPEIDYLAKDYHSFRRLMLDRMSAIIPEWQERNPADIGVMLVEVLAYVGDQLSYAQDAAATEAYLGTARQRISVRRHARARRLPDRRGRKCSCVGGRSGGVRSRMPTATRSASGTPLLTRFPGRRSVVPSTDLVDAIRTGCETFETMTEVTLRASLNRLEFYTWSNRSVLPSDWRDQGDALPARMPTSNQGCSSFSRRFSGRRPAPPPTPRPHTATSSA